MQYCSLQHWILLSSPVKMKVAQSCPTLCNPMDDISMEFSRPEYWSGYLSLLEGILNEQCFLFGPATSFFLGPLVVLLHFSLVPYRTPSDLGDSSVVSYLFVLLYSSWNSHGKCIGVGCHSLLQWITFCQNSLLGPTHLGWPYTTPLITSMSYASPFTMTRQWTVKGKVPIPGHIRSNLLGLFLHIGSPHLYSIISSTISEKDHKLGQWARGEEEDYEAQETWKMLIKLLYPQRTLSLKPFKLWERRGFNFIYFIFFNFYFLLVGG